MHDVVVMAVRNAVSAATTTFTAMPERCVARALTPSLVYSLLAFSASIALIFSRTS